VTIHELLHTDKFGGRSWPGEVLRLALLRTHYRQPIDFTVKALEESEQAYFKWLRSIYDVFAGDVEQIIRLDSTRPREQVLHELSDDLNTASIVNGLSIVSRSLAAYEASEKKFAEDDATEFLSDLELLGLFSSERAKHLFDVALGSPDKLDQQEQENVRALIDSRLAARAAKNWKESDRIRDELAAMGIALKDNKDGTTTWEVKR
jgi:cysteinyl-tRNA synthetase